MNLGNLGIKSIIAAILLAVTGTITNTYFCEGSIWYKDDAQGQRYYVYLLGDYHYEYSKTLPLWADLLEKHHYSYKDALGELLSSKLYKECKALEQKMHSQLIAYLTQRKQTREIKVIIEHHSVEPCNNMLHERGIPFPDLPRLPATLCFAHLCKQHEIPVTNVEFRYLRQLLGILSYIANKKDDGIIISAQFLTTIDEIIMLDEQLLDTISTYTDGKLSTHYYQTTIDLCKGNVEKLKKFKHNHLTLNATLNKKHENDFDDIETETGCPIIDMQTMHEIYLNQDKDIFVLEGTHHILEIEKIVPLLGYKKLADYNDLNWLIDDVLIDLGRNLKTFCRGEDYYWKRAERVLDLERFFFMAEKPPHKKTTPRVIAAKLTTAAFYTVPIAVCALLTSDFAKHNNPWLKYIGSCAAGCSGLFFLTLGIRNVYTYPNM